MSRRSGRRRRQQSGLFVHDDVARAAGVHGRDRHAERARFEQHAAQRLGAVRRERSARRVRESPASRAIEPAGEAHVEAGVAAACSGRRVGPSPTTRAATRDGRVDRRHQMLAAFVGRELADVDRVGAAMSAAPRGGGRAAASASGRRPGSGSVRRAAGELGRARARSRAIAELTAMMASASASVRAPAEVRAHVGDGGAPAARRAARGRTHASSSPAEQPGRASRRSRGSDRTSSRPASSRGRWPPPAHLRRARRDGARGRQQVLAVDDVDAPSRMRSRKGRERAREAFVLEVVADERHGGAGCRIRGR